MSFTSGRVSFVRFRVTGDAPAAADDTALSILKEHAFVETPIGAPDEIEAGFITGEHILDTQFTYEKNGFGQCLLFALRIDTHKVPAEIKQAYKKINEQAAAEGNPSGFASKTQKRDAADQASRQVHEDLAAGKFRRSKSVPILWDLKNKMLYCGAATNSAIEQISSRFRQAFACELELISAGTLAGHLFRHSGKGRDYEDLRPSAFTPPPAATRRDADDADATPRDPSVPLVPWVAQAVDLKDFLGNEFFIYLWHLTESADGRIPTADGPSGATPAQVFLAIDKQLDMDCGWGVNGKQSLRGDGPSHLSEAGEALVTGKWPRKAGLLLSDGEHQWELTLHADRMAISGAAMPEIPEAQSPRELIEARLELIRALARTLDAMYQAFLDHRTRSSWPTRRQAIAQWIRERRKKHQAQRHETKKEKVATDKYR